MNKAQMRWKHGGYINKCSFRTIFPFDLKLDYWEENFQLDLLYEVIIIYRIYSETLKNNSLVS